MKKIIFLLLLFLGFFFVGGTSVFAGTSQIDFCLNPPGTTYSSNYASSYYFYASKDFHINTGYMYGTGLTTPLLKVYKSTDSLYTNLLLDRTTVPAFVGTDFLIDYSIESGHWYGLSLNNSGSTWVSKKCYKSIVGNNYFSTLGMVYSNTIPATSFSTPLSLIELDFHGFSYSFDEELSLTCPSFDNIDALIYYNTNETLSTSGLVVLDDTFQYTLSYPGGVPTFLPQISGNNITYNGLPVDYIGNNIVISGNYNVFVTGGVLYIQDFVNTGSSFTGYIPILNLGSGEVESFTGNMFAGFYQQAQGFVLANFKTFFIVMLISLLVIFFYRSLFTKKRY